MTTIGTIYCSRARFPHLYSTLQRARGNVTAIRRPSQGRHQRRMPTIGGEKRSRCRFPHLHCAIFTPRGNIPTIRGPSYCSCTTPMTTIDENSGTYPLRCLLQSIGKSLDSGITIVRVFGKCSHYHLLYFGRNGW